MRIEHKYLLITKLLFAAAKSGSSLPLYVIKKYRKKKTEKRIFVEILTGKMLEDIALGLTWGNIREAGPYHTLQFCGQVAKFHGLGKLDKMTKEERERFLTRDFSLYAYRPSRGYVKGDKRIYVNPKHIEIPKTALILFGDSEIAKF